MPVIDKISMKLQFAGIREKYNTNNSEYLNIFKQTSTSGFTSNGTIYLAVQGENRVGYNLPTTKVKIDYLIGEEIVIEFKSSIITKAEDVYYFIISATTSNNNNLFQIARYIPTVLPSSLVLNKNLQIAINEAVALPSDLPTNNLVNGMIRIVSSLSNYYEYKYNSNATIDNINTLYGTNGRWIKRSNPFPYITDTENVLGCNINFDVLDFNTDILNKPSAYIMDNTDGETVKYWYINNTPYSIPEGSQIGINVYLNNDNKSIAFKDKLKVVFHGYVNTITGELDTSNSTGLFQMQYIDEPISYIPGRMSNLLLQKELPPGEGVVISIYPKFNAAEINNSITPNSKLHCEFFTYLLNGDITTIGTLTGDIIYQQGELRRIVPGGEKSIIGLPGSGVVDNVQFPLVSETIVTDLEENTANQQIIINGDGTLYLQPSNYSIKTTEALRAKVSTLAGESTYINKTLNINSTNKSILINIDHPVTVTDKGIIRANYPDVIAGNNKGEFNPPYVIVYISNGSTIYKYETLCLVSNTQTIEITTFSGLTTVSSIPAQNDTKFSLYKIDDITLSAGSFGSIPIANYTIYVGYRYTGHEVTSITHAVSEGCISEWGGKLSDLSEVTKYWSTPVTSSTIRSLEQGETWNGQIRYVSDKKWLYRFDLSSTGTDDGITVFKPDYISINDGGRWLELERIDIALILEQLKNIDGAGSGIDADFLDGFNSSYFATATHNHDSTYAVIAHNHDSVYATTAHTHALANGTTNGFMSSADYTKLAGLPDTIPETALLSVFGRTGNVVATVGDYTAEQILGLSDAATDPYGTEANTVCQGNDSRLSNSRIPTGNANGVSSDIEGTYPSGLVLKSVATAGTYSGVTIDVKGRVISGTTTVTESNLPTNVAYIDKVQTWEDQQRRTIKSVTSDALININVTESTSFKLLLQHDAVITLNNGVEGDSIILHVQNEGGRTLNISNGHFVEELVIPTAPGAKTKIFCEYVWGIWLCDYPGAGLAYM